ncbi:hypothetical protein [Kitasatospora sp. NPDC002965]|uniref:hypothetical protein n=1 Tax=Kitasatospora sp. NPDC002965 TaxID=3154775 RepID=UPI0033AE3495
MSSASASALVAALRRDVSPAVPCPEAVVLAQGLLHSPTPWPAGMPRRSIDGSPFRNAWRVARTATGLTYTEGFALRAVPAGVVHHAWCVDPAGRALDPTWPDGRGLAYLGLPMTTDWVESVRRRTCTRTAFVGILDEGVQRSRDAERVLTFGVPGAALVRVGTPVTRPPAV